MKKGGKKWRKLQKETEERRAFSEANAGEPFSKARTRKILCLHYDGRPGGILPGHCYSKLVPLNADKCKCHDCGKVFSAEKYEQMNRLVHYLSNKGCVTDMEYIAELSKGLEPVYYCRISETEIKIVETVEDKIMMSGSIGVIM